MAPGAYGKGLITEFDTGQRGALDWTTGHGIIRHIGTDMAWLGFGFWLHHRAMGFRLNRLAFHVGTRENATLLGTSTYKPEGFECRDISTMHICIANSRTFVQCVKRASKYCQTFWRLES